MAQFTYMGTKRLLSATIAETVSTLNNGPFLDLFAGIASVAAALSTSRQIWCNDAQCFSSTLTGALYQSHRDEIDARKIQRAISFQYKVNLNQLLEQFTELATYESESLNLRDPDRQRDAQMKIKAESSSAIPNLLSTYSMFTTTHAGSYIGLRQAMELDSIRAGADQALEAGMLDADEHRWAILASCRAISAVSNSTGHFAQYLTPNAKNINRVLAKRRRSVILEWEAALSDMRAIGSSEWRKSNKVFRSDANHLLARLASDPQRPGVIYADPPYTDDQYSRFYHLLETAILYDYPVVSGKGEYRPDRFTSPFSQKTTVAAAFEELIVRASSVGADLIVSYPSNGLLKDSDATIMTLLQSHFQSVLDPQRIEHSHSTMGGSDGRQKNAVQECVYVARNARTQLRARQSLRAAV